MSSTHTHTASTTKITPSTVAISIPHAIAQPQIADRRQESEILLAMLPAAAQRPPMIHMILPPHHPPTPARAPPPLRLPNRLNVPLRHPLRPPPHHPLPPNRPVPHLLRTPTLPAFRPQPPRPSLHKPPQRPHLATPTALLLGRLHPRNCGEGDGEMPKNLWGRGEMSPQDFHFADPMAKVRFSAHDRSATRHIARFNLMVIMRMVQRTYQSFQRVARGLSGPPGDYCELGPGKLYASLQLAYKHSAASG